MLSALRDVMFPQRGSSEYLTVPWRNGTLLRKGSSDVCRGVVLVLLQDGKHRLPNNHILVFIRFKIEVAFIFRLRRSAIQLLALVPKGLSFVFVLMGWSLLPNAL